MSKCGRNMSKTRRYDSVKCPACVVFAKSRARHVHVMSLNLLTSRKGPLNSIFDKPGLLCSLVTGFLQKTKTLSLTLHLCICRLQHPVSIVIQSLKS